MIRASIALALLVMILTCQGTALAQAPGVAAAEFRDIDTWTVLNEVPGRGAQPAAYHRFSVLELPPVENSNKATLAVHWEGQLPAARPSDLEWRLLDTDG